MSIFGVVCEFNPFHLGHKYLFDCARTMGAEKIICAMSGNAVQRGSLAVADKYIRGESAVVSGADLVLELSYPWCAASAEYFAAASIKILSEFCDTVIFGSECGDIDLLFRAASLAESRAFRESYAKRCAEGEGSAKVYFELLSEGAGYEFSSNDLLGIEYIRAALRLDCAKSLKFVTVTRKGAAYRDKTAKESELPSATAIRELWREGNIDNSRGFMPEAVYEIMRGADMLGELTDERELDGAVVSFFRLHTGEEIEAFAECSGGLGNRIATASRFATGVEELIGAVGTKRYTDARIRRAILFAMTGVTEEILKSEPKYTCLLGASKGGRELLSDLRRQEHIEIVTKAADAPKDFAQTVAAEKLDALFTLARKNKAEACSVMKKSAYVEK